MKCNFGFKLFTFTATDAEAVIADDAACRVEEDAKPDSIIIGNNNKVVQIVGDGNTVNFTAKGLGSSLSSTTDRGKVVLRGTGKPHKLFGTVSGLLGSEIICQDQTPLPHYVEVRQYSPLWHTSRGKEGLILQAFQI